jgi:hypothetical protein
MSQNDEVRRQMSHNVGPAQDRSDMQFRITHKKPLEDWERLVQELACWPYLPERNMGGDGS